MLAKTGRIVISPTTFAMGVRGRHFYHQTKNRRKCHTDMERYEDSQLYRIRHSLAHVMAQAMIERFPEAKIAIGPPIEDGFYYDFDLPRSITEDDLQWVENRMKEIVCGDHEFKMREVSPEEALTFFKGQPYKEELINDLVNGRVDENGS